MVAEWPVYPPRRGMTKEEDGHAIGASSSLRQFGQYQGAGVVTGFGLRLRHLAQRNRLPLTAVFGRTFFPVVGMFFAIGISIRHCQNTRRDCLRQPHAAVRQEDLVAVPV